MSGEPKWYAASASIPDRYLFVRKHTHRILVVAGRVAVGPGRTVGFEWQQVKSDLEKIPNVTVVELPNAEVIA